MKMLQDGQVSGDAWKAIEDPRRKIYVAATMIRRWRLVACSAIAALLLALLFVSSRPVTYTASTHLLIFSRELSTGPYPIITPGRADGPLVDNMIEIFRSRNVLANVIESLKLNEDVEGASDRGALQVIRDWFMPTAADAFSSAEIAFEQTIERFKRRLSVERVGTSHTVLVSFAASDPGRAAAVANEIALSAARVLTGSEAGALKGSALRERLQGLGPNAFVISEADPPVRPDGPRRIVVALGALLAGLGLGAMLALFLDFRDRTIRTAEQVGALLGLECFGTVARHSGWTGRGTAMGAAHRSPPGLTQGLERALTVFGSILGMRIIGVTSSVPGEGVTTIAAGLAQMAVRAGKRALVIQAADCDQLTDVLTDAVRKHDLIIVDLPPLSSGPAVSAMTHKLDGLLLILEWGADDADAVRRALDSSGPARSKFAGVILTMAPAHLIGRYGDKLAGAQAKLSTLSLGQGAAKEQEKSGPRDQLAPV